MDGRGFANHLKAKHPILYAAKHPELTAHELAQMGLLTKDSDLTDLVEIGNAVNGVWDVKFVPTTIDPVNHPPHYTFGKYEVIDVLQDWFATNPLLWQVVKYCARADHKGNPVQDLEKAKFYLEREIQRRKDKETAS
jgi:hypothetical protein